MLFLKRITLVIFLAFELFAQVRQAQTNYTFLNQGYVLESLSGNGYNQHFQTKIYNASSNNPASLSEFSKFKLGLSYQFSSMIDPVYESNPAYLPKFRFAHKRTNKALPQSLGIAVPVSRLSFGMGISQRYSSTWELIKETPLVNLQGIAQQNIVEETIVYAQTNIISFKLLNIFGLKNTLTLGFNFSNNFLYSQIENIVNSKIELYDYNIAVGLRYKTSNFGVGIHYESSSDFKKEKIEKNYSLISTGALPAALNSGILWRARENLKVSLNSSFIFWEDIPNGRQNEFNNHLNQIIAAINACHSFNNYSITLGILYTDRNYKKHNRDNSSKFDYKVIMPMLGMNMNLYKLQFDLLYANTTFFSADWQKQNIFKLAVSFRFKG